MKNKVIFGPFILDLDREKLEYKKVKYINRKDRLLDFSDEETIDFLLDAIKYGKYNNIDIKTKLIVSAFGDIEIYCYTDDKSNGLTIDDVTPEVINILYKNNIADIKDLQHILEHVSNLEKHIKEFRSALLPEILNLDNKK